MKSLREVARNVAITDSPLRVRTLAQRYGLTPPFSVIQLMSAIQNTPPEEAKFEYVITTPTGTPLGGRARLTVRSDGTYKSEIYMRTSGEPNYVFSVRAMFNALNVGSFAMQHSGFVRGTSLNPFNPTRDYERISAGTAEGFHLFIKDNWPAMKTGTLSATKEYRPTGISGVVLDLAKFFMEASAHTLGAGMGVVIGLGHEMGKVFGDLGIVGGFTVMSGIVVFASGGTLVMAIPVGVTVGAVTEALINKRQLNTDEAAFAAQIFGGSLPPRDKIWLTNLTGIGDRAFAMPGFDNGNIYLNMGDSFNDPMAPTKSYPARGQLLIHELVHAWQIHHSSFLPGTVCKGVVNQARNEFGGSAYAYGPPGQPWGKFNPEQQGSIVDDYFSRVRPNPMPSGDKVVDNPNDPYFRYISDNIRAGRS